MSVHVYGYKPKPLFISIQGNIGSGKSTIIKNLKEYFDKELAQSQLTVCFLQEPVDIWETIKNKEGKSMVELFYSNQEKYSFAFQMMAYISRLSILKKAIKENYDIIISERSLTTDKNVFAKMLFDSGKIEDIEYQIYLKWFEEFQNDIRDEYVIYIKTNPETAFYRVNKRSRKGEDIPIEYLQDCNHYHDTWLYREKYDKMLIIDGNKDTDKEPDMVQLWIRTIREWIHTIY